MPETPGTAQVDDLLEHVHEGKYVIPYFQRGFEWHPGLVCDLIKSVLQDYYAGLILLWDLDDEEAAKEEWDPVWGASRASDNKPELAVLDGQQRLSSLYYAIYNPPEKFPNRKTYYVFYLDLNAALNDDFEDAVDYSYHRNHRSWEKLWDDGSEAADTGVVPMCILSATDPSAPGRAYIDSRDFEDWVGRYLDANRERLSADVTTHRVYQIFNGILSYSFVYYPLSSDRELPDICNIFARVNEKGMKLSTFDLMNAFLYPKGVRLRKELWDQLGNEQLKEIDSKMDEYLLKLISLVKQNYCSSKYIYNLIPGEAVRRRDESGEIYEEVLVETGEEFEQLWSRACKFAEEARSQVMNTGVADFGAIKSGFIPNTTMLPVLGAMLWMDEDGDGEDKRRFLRQWYWSAVLSEDYSGSSDTVMSRDYRDWLDRVNGVGFEAPPRRLQMVDADFVQELQLREVNRGSARYNAVVCMLALNDARDFYKGQIVGRADFQDERIDDHHIFPSKVSGLSPKTSASFAGSKDSVLNRTLLFDETNRRIKTKRPSEYVAEMIETHGGEGRVRELLEGHFIWGAAYDALVRDDFDAFIDEREKCIKQHMVGVLELMGDGTPASQ